MTKKKSFIEVLTLIAVLVIIGFVIPAGIGFVAKGFDTQQVINQFVIYGLFAAFGIIMIITGLAIEWANKRGDKKYGESYLFASPGKKPASPFFKRFTNGQLFHLSIIILGFLGLIISRFRQTSFTAFPVIEQQFTETGSILFTTFLVPVAENLYFTGILVLALVGIGAIARRNSWSYSDFLGVSTLILFVLGGLVQVAYHSLRYSGSDISLMVVFFFWGIGALMTLFTGSFIPFWVLHVVNNLIYDLRRFISADSTSIIIGAILVVIAILYPIIWRGRTLGRKT